MTDFLMAAAGQPWAYAVVVLFCLLDGFFPPIPSETVVVAVAALAVGHGPAILGLLVVAAAAGAFLGDNIAYLMGRRMGISRFAWMRRPLMQRAFSKAGRELEQRAVSMILVARFLPVARVAVNLTAGATGYPQRKFMTVSALSATLWAIYSVAIGAVAGTWLREHPLLGLVTAMVAAGLLGILIEKIMGTFRARRIKGESARLPELVPAQLPGREPAPVLEPARSLAGAARL